RSVRTACWEAALAPSPWIGTVITATVPAGLVETSIGRLTCPVATAAFLKSAIACRASGELTSPVLNATVAGSPLPGKAFWTALYVFTTSRLGGRNLNVGVSVLMVRAGS